MINLTENEDIRILFETAVEHWGVPAQILVLAEECSELSAAATRILTHKGTEEDLMSEMADVYLMLSQMVYALESGGQFDRIVEKKIEKLKKRLKSQGAKIEVA